jgi:hypothetical protein
MPFECALRLPVEFLSGANRPENVDFHLELVKIRF